MAGGGTGTGTAGTGTAGSGRDALLDRAVQLVRVDRVEAAYPLIAEALREDPGDSYALELLATCHQLESRWSDMLGVLDMAARRAPDNPQIHRRRSTALRHLGRIPEALAAADQARTLAPDDARGELVRAEALLRQRGTRAVLAALASTTRARELDPESVWAHVTEGRVQRRMAEFGRARAAYLAALRLAPDNTQALYGLATLDAEWGRAVRAAPSMGGVLQAVPNDPVALRAATLGARQVLWLLTDLGCVLLLLATLLLGTALDLIPSRLLGSTVGVLITVAATTGVLVMLRWRLSRLSAPIRTLLRTNRRRFTFAVAPLRLGALAVGMLIASLGPYPPEAVEIVGAVLLTAPFVTLLVRWRTRAFQEFFRFVRRRWFRLRRRSSSPG
ncbi:tetratricopeptide repeat protein [Plantactinospora sonchi]|uniref:Tetratricopeptide repeat protein n=1 Tax=Plantactinospora sonchi TaxID=1544735 RepID=A0ABU7RXE2_9ACTN